MSLVDSYPSQIHNRESYDVQVNLKLFFFNLFSILSRKTMGIISQTYGELFHKSQPVSIGHPLHLQETTMRDINSHTSQPSPLCGSGLLLGERSESEVRLDNAELGEELLGLLVVDGGVDDDIITRDPVDGCGDPVLVTSLERVNNTEDLGGVAAG